jgi:flagellar hook protein FlgE
VANTGTNGTVAANTLELSNVDLTEEFVNLITTERAFQANTKVVTTGDTMLETVINMIR